MQDLGQTGCDSVAGATRGQAGGLGGAQGVAVSPDGSYVYVAAYGNSAVAVLKRNPATGALSSDGCLQDLGQTGCDSVSGATHGQAGGLGGAQGVAVSPDGSYVYVAGYKSSAVAVLKRNPATGGLSSDGCLQDLGQTGCDSVAGATHGQAGGLGEASAVAVSPDGNYVYVAGYKSSAVAVLKRNPATGALSSDGCLQDLGQTGCDSVAGATRGQAGGLGQAGAVAVSPDGNYVYVAGEGSNAVAVLKRNPATGALSSDGCLQDLGGVGCDSVAGATHGQAPGLNTPQGVAVSPDGSYVYVAAYGNSAVAVLKRNPATGALSSDGCLQDRGQTGCDSVAGASHGQAPGLGGANAVAVSPDGSYVYVASYDSSAVAVLKRNPATGGLSSDGCLQDLGGVGCDSVPGATHGQAPGLGGASAVAVSPHGAYVYVTGYYSSALAVLKRFEPTPGSPLPVLSGLRVSPHTFSIAGRVVKGRCVKPTNKNARKRRCQRAIKLWIAYALNTPGTVTFTLKRQAPGRTVQGHCVRPTRKNAKNKRCIRLVMIPGALVQSAKAGKHTFMFNGRIGGRTLGPGTYSLIATPAGGRPRTVTFRIVR